MNKYITIPILFFIWGIMPIFGQDYQSTTVQTPKDVTVDALQFKYWIYEDYDVEEIAYWNDWWTNGYNCRILANSTKYYNCHGYAWHNIEGRMGQSDLRWINDVDIYGAPIYNVTKYYLGANKSYEETESVVNHLRVSYFPRDHSAVTTEDQDSVISKWANGPLVKHTLAQCPFYQNSQIKYYKLFPGIDGSSSELCVNQERTFTSNTSITGSTYSWTRNTSLLDYVSGAGTTDYRVKAKSNDGEGWVRLEITTPSGEVATTSKKYVWVNKPYVNPASIQFECADGPGYLCTNFFGNEFSFTFDYPYNYFNIKLTNLSETQTYDQFTIYDTWGTIDCFPPEGTYLFHVRGNNDCGTATNWNKKEVEYVDCGMRGLFSLDIYPNPSTEQATITIVSNENMNAVTNNVDDAWQLEVYTQGQLLKLNIPAIIDNKYVLNTSGWKPGMYFIRVYYKDEVLWGTLIVNK
ncbi:MAG: T9SS type A sorting domain-containing protein [Bacteroidota bacterium]